MDTLTRMRAFIDVVEAEGFFRRSKTDRTIQGAALQICTRTEDDLGALLLNRTTTPVSP